MFLVYRESRVSNLKKTTHHDTYRLIVLGATEDLAAAKRRVEEERTAIKLDCPSAIGHATNAGGSYLLTNSDSVEIINLWISEVPSIK